MELLILLLVVAVASAGQRGGGRVRVLPRPVGPRPDPAPLPPTVAEQVAVELGVTSTAAAREEIYRRAFWTRDTD